MPAVSGQPPFGGEIEPLHVRHERYGYSGDWVYRVRTFILAKSGETYASFLYSRNLLQNEIDYHYTPKIEQNALCAAWNGTIYAAGPFAEADSAILEIEAELRNRDKVLKSKTFTIAGERLENEVFGFPYSLDMLGGGFRAGPRRICRMSCPYIISPDCGTGITGMKTEAMAYATQIFPVSSRCMTGAGGSWSVMI